MDSSRAVGNFVNQSSKRIFNVGNSYEYIVPAVDRAARILMLLRVQGRDMTIAEITEATGWHKSSVHKLLVTLSHHGLLDRDAFVDCSCVQNDGG